MIKKILQIAAVLIIVNNLFGCTLHRSLVSSKNHQIKGVIQLAIANERQLMRFSLVGQDYDNFNLQITTPFYVELLEIENLVEKNRVICQGRILTMDELNLWLTAKLGCEIPLKSVINWLCVKEPQFSSKWSLKYNSMHKIIAARNDDLHFVFEYDEKLQPVSLKIIHELNRMIIKLRITTSKR